MSSCREDKDEDEDTEVVVVRRRRKRGRRFISFILLSRGLWSCVIVWNLYIFVVSLLVFDDTLSLTYP
jgi:hypothetical protein